MQNNHAGTAVIPPVQLEARKTHMLKVRVSAEEVRALHLLAEQVQAPNLSQAVRHVLHWAMAQQQDAGNA